MQVPVGYLVQNGQFVPDDWTKIIFNSVVWSRFPHMLLASYLTGAFCVASSGAWYLLRDKSRAEALVMLRMGLVLAAVLMPLQLGFGHLVGDYVHDFQPAKFAAIEGRWHAEQPASEVLIALPDPAHETNTYEIKIPVLGSIIGSMSLTSKEVGLTDFPPQDRPPVLIPFATFRIMVGCGLIMLALAWLGSYLSLKRRLERSRVLLWSIFLSFPLPFIAILTGWYTAEVGRQPDLRSVANRSSHDTVPDGWRRNELAYPVRCNLPVHLFVRHPLHLQTLTRWPLATCHRASV